MIKQTTARIIYHGKAHKRRTKTGRKAIAERLKVIRCYRGTSEYSAEQHGRALTAHAKGDI